MQLDTTETIVNIPRPATSRAGAAPGDYAEGAVSGQPRELSGTLAGGIWKAVSQVRRFATWANESEAEDEQIQDDEIYRSLGHAISRLRWMTLFILLVITLIQPRLGRLGLMNWELFLTFGLYNAIIELALTRLPDRRALLWRVMVDLPAAGLVYFGSARPGSPQGDLIFMAVICAALSMPLRLSLIYTAAAIAMLALIEPTLPLWSSDLDAVRELGGRMVLLAFAGTGTAIMYRRLAIERARAKSARKEAERLEALDKLRDDFISSITHDLRTPFTAVRAGLGMVEMSVADRLRPEEMHLLNNVRRNSDRLGILINDLLAFTQFEAGALRLDMQPLDASEIVTSAATALQPLIQEKKQILDVYMEEPLPHRGDRRKLEQVITNLLDNAHRHTPPGTRITVSGHISPGEVTVEIRDDGPGIPPQECEAIFERFHKADVSEGGWGLGLTIAQAITEKHGGRIWVESELARGTAFFVSLPRLTDTITSALTAQEVA